jgi:hypothetical protein
MDPYLGHDLTAADCELLSFARVGRAHRERESTLFHRKWYDYRHLHPVKATYLFAHRYEECVRAFYVETKDKDGAGEIKVFTPADVFQSHELTGIWIARQAMDALGCRYEFGIKFAIRRFTDRGWRMFPRPNQLYGVEFLLDLQDAWRRQCAASLEMAKHPRFKNINYEWHPDQDAHHDWVVKQIKLRQNHVDRILARVFDEDLLPLGVATCHFDPKIVNQALKHMTVQ